jgi:hypothetical protein
VCACVRRRNEQECDAAVCAQREDVSVELDLTASSHGVCEASGMLMLGKVRTVYVRTCGWPSGRLGWQWKVCVMFQIPVPCGWQQMMGIHTLAVEIEAVR